MDLINPCLLLMRLATAFLMVDAQKQFIALNQLDENDGLLTNCSETQIVDPVSCMWSQIELLSAFLICIYGTMKNLMFNLLFLNKSTIVIFSDAFSSLAYLQTSFL